MVRRRTLASVRFERGTGLGQSLPCLVDRLRVSIRRASAEAELRGQSLTRVQLLEDWQTFSLAFGPPDLEIAPPMSFTTTMQPGDVWLIFHVADSDRALSPQVVRLSECG